jgi:S1-C subfamily serine protease
VREVARKVRPAVVQITSQQTVLDRLNQPFTVPAGVGSGVIYDQQGHILTNSHVIEGGDKIQVSLPDGRTLPGTLVGADEQTDLAVLQITGENLPIAQLGSSNNLEIGDWVVAIGNALGLSGGPTVTVGVVGALGRTVQEPGSGLRGVAGPFLFDLIQTDAAINPGNSGGPLVNLAGEVVGINTLVAGQSEQGVRSQGIGFAIAMSAAKPIADELVATGRVVHPYMGIHYVALSPSLAARLGISASHGVVITDVLPGSPADVAGLRPRDAITNINGAELEDDSSLAQITGRAKVGDVLNMTGLRGSQSLTAQLTLAPAPS